MIKQPSIQVSVCHKGSASTSQEDQQSSNKVNRINILEENLANEPYLDDLYPGIAETIRNDSKGSHGTAAAENEEIIWMTNNG